MFFENIKFIVRENFNRAALCRNLNTPLRAKSRMLTVHVMGDASLYGLNVGTRFLHCCVVAWIIPTI